MLSEVFLEEIAQTQGILLSRAAKIFPPYRLGRPVDPGTLWTWIVKGVTGPDGQKIHLEAARYAKKWVTTRGAIKRFLQAQTPATGAGAATPRTKLATAAV